MTANEAIDYIENCGWSSTRLGLDRTKILLNKLGDPQKNLKFIHVAGTNGKGSTCAMLANILKCSGYKTGLTTSPYIQNFRERIQVNGEIISEADLAKWTEKVSMAAESMEDHPSQFELVTAIAMCYFAHCQCDIVVLEVGMGGALDSTNVIDCPEVAIITPIALDHTEYLGKTIAAIAETKGGIIKPHCDCVCWETDAAVKSIINKLCLNNDANVIFTNAEEIKKGEDVSVDPLSGQSFFYRDKKYFIHLLGPHQCNNALLVIKTLEILKRKGWNITDKSIETGFATVSWPARLEVLSNEPLFILDGGHNPQCAEALVESLKVLLPNQKCIGLVGMLGDKDYPLVAKIAAPYFSEILCVTPPGPRALQAEGLAACFGKEGVEAMPYNDIKQGLLFALDKAKTNAQPLIAFGSLYLAGVIRTFFGEMNG